MKLFSLVLTCRRDPLLSLYSVSYLWYSLIATLAVIIIGLIVSLITHSKETDPIDPKLSIRMADLCRCKEVDFGDKVKFLFLHFKLSISSYRRTKTKPIGQEVHSILKNNRRKQYPLKPLY